MNSAELEIEAPQTLDRNKNAFAFGLDVSKNTFMTANACSDNIPFQAPDLRKLKTRNFARTQEQAQVFLEWAESQVPEGYDLVVVMEATGPYSLQLAAWLLALRPHLRLSIIDPKRAKAYAKSLGVRNKTDKVDARVLAAFAAERQPVTDEPLEQIYLDMRALARMRLFLMFQLTAMTNHMEMQVPEILTRSISAEILKMSQSNVALLQKQIKGLEDKLRQLVAEGPQQLSKDIEQLDLICGVGFITAASVIGEFGDLRRFRTSRQLVAMAGLNPEVKESGKWIGQSHLSKRGSVYGRRALYMGSISAIKSDCDFRDFYDRLTDKSHKCKMVALVAVMRKMLVTMRAVLVTETPYQRHHDPCEKLGTAA